MSDVLDLAAALSALPGKKTEPYQKCGVTLALAELAEKDPAAADQLRAVADRADVAPTALAGVLAQHGIDYVKAHTIRRHRRRLATGDACSCPA